MPLKAAFAEVDITPPPGTQKIGWIRLVIGTKVADAFRKVMANLDQVQQIELG